MEKSYLDFKKKYLEKKVELSDIDFAFCNLFNKKRYELNNLTLDQNDSLKIKKILERLSKKEPLSNIFQKVNFYGRDFFVNRYVLSPRFETEELVYHAKNIIKKENLKDVLDLCSGSGCIGLTLKLEDKNLNVTLSDISEFAINISKQNSRNLESKVKFVKSDLFENLEDSFDIVVSNPPYISNSYRNKLDFQVFNYDPHISLFAKENGLYYYKKIERQTRNFKKLKFMIFEIGFDQKESLKEIFKDYKIEFIKDISNKDRILIVKR